MLIIPNISKPVRVNRQTASAIDLIIPKLYNAHWAKIRNYKNFMSDQFYNFFLS